MNTPLVRGTNVRPITKTGRVRAELRGALQEATDTRRKQGTDIDALDAAKAPVSHTHTLSQITDAGSAAGYNIGTVGDSVPLLTGAGLVWEGNQTFDGRIDFGSFDSGGASSGKRIQSGGTFFDSSRDTTATVGHFRFWNPNNQVGGIATVASGTNFNTTSDAQLKTNRRRFRDEVSVTALLKAINVEAYDWLDRKGRSINVRGHGFIAQDLDKILPEAVTRGKGAPASPGYEPWAVDYSKLVPLLVASLQEALERIEVLEAKVAT